MRVSAKSFAAIIAVAIAAPGFSQSSGPQPSTPAFEVVSVNAAPDVKGWVGPRADDPQRFRALTLVSELIDFAYHVKDFQILKAPGWVNHDKYAVQATAGKPSSEDQMRQMVQGLLADRFQLKLHRETREIPIYALVVGKDGPKLTAAKQDGNNIQVGAGIMKARGITMDMFSMILTENLDRPVIDKTGLTGHYDFDLNFDPSPPPPGSTWSPMGPAIFAPIQGLGLKLEAQKASFEMLVIDSIDRPSAN